MSSLPETFRGRYIDPFDTLLAINEELKHLEAAGAHQDIINAYKIRAALTKYT